MSKVKTTFSVGDVVKLKGEGSPWSMTVEKVAGDQVYTVWMNAEAKIQRDHFNIETLSKAVKK